MTAPAQQELTVFNELYEKHRDKIKDDRLLVVQGKVQRDEFIQGFRVSAEELLDLADFRARFASGLRIAMNGKADAKRLQDTLAPYRESGGRGCTVLVQYENAGAACEIALGESWRVRPDDRLLGELAAWLSPEAVQFKYRTSA